MLQRRATIGDFETWLHEEIKQLKEELENWRYKPKPVRRVEIPKPEGRVRLLGVPCIRDRVVQSAIKQLLEPILDHFKPLRIEANKFIRIINLALPKDHKFDMHASFSLTQGKGRFECFIGLGGSGSKESQIEDQKIINTAMSVTSESDKNSVHPMWEIKNYFCDEKLGNNLELLGDNLRLNETNYHLSIPIKAYTIYFYIQSSDTEIKRLTYFFQQNNEVMEHSIKLSPEEVANQGPTSEDLTKEVHALAKIRLLEFDIKKLLFTAFKKGEIEFNTEGNSLNSDVHERILNKILQIETLMRNIKSLLLSYYEYEDVPPMRTKGS